MTATPDTAIKVWDELSIDPQPIIPPDAIHPAPAEAERRGREFVIYKVPSQSGTGTYTVTLNTKTGTLYCTCEAARRERKCKHLASVLFKRAYELAYRLYADLSIPELEERQRDHIEMERGALVQVRAWRAANAAIGELVRERTESAA
jgi:hypothetical protein